jgi:chromosomal replication initiator protein
MNDLTNNMGHMENIEMPKTSQSTPELTSDHMNASSINSQDMAGSPAQASTLRNSLNREVKQQAADFSLENTTQMQGLHSNMELEKQSNDIVWDRIQAKLKTKLGPEIFSSWFGRMKLVSLSRGQVIHSVPTAFLRSWINNHYADLLLELWQEEQSDIIKVDISLRSAVRSTQVQSPAKVTNEQKTNAQSQSATITPFPNQMSENVQRFTGSPLDPTYTFETFVEGAANRMACAAAKSIFDSSEQAITFNPLFIHASVGQGKTHLLQAIAWQARRAGYKKVLYLTAEYFMWRFATAIRDQSALSLKESLRDIDLLIIDDMQFLQGKSIQQEFCHLLNALIDSAKQVVVAADRPPAELESLHARVRSRLQGGVALEIKAPDYDLRRSMLEIRYQEAQRDDPELEIPTEVIDYVARSIVASGRDLDGAFNQILLQHRFSEGPLTIEAIEKTLGHLVKHTDQRRVRIEDIQKVVGRHYNVSKQDLLSKRRTREIVRPRQIAMYLSKLMTSRSLPEIGKRFGGRDHTTVLHAVRKIEDISKEDSKIKHEVELLKRLIEE